MVEYNVRDNVVQSEPLKIIVGHLVNSPPDEKFGEVDPMNSYPIALGIELLVLTQTFN